MSPPPRTITYVGNNAPIAQVRAIPYVAGSNYQRWHLVKIPGTEQFYILNAEREEHPTSPDGSQLGCALALDDPTSTNPSAILARWDKNDDSQLWRKVELPNGLVHIVHAKTNKVLTYGIHRQKRKLGSVALTEV